MVCGVALLMIFSISCFLSLHIISYSALNGRTSLGTTFSFEAPAAATMMLDGLINDDFMISHEGELLVVVVGLRFIGRDFGSVESSE